MRNRKVEIVQKVFDKIIKEDFTIDNIDNLCSSISISKKTFYVNFKSKEEFLENVISQLNNEVSLELENLIKEQTEDTFKIINLLKSLINRVQKLYEILKCCERKNPFTDFLEEEFEMIFTNALTILLQKLEDDNQLKQKTNYILFAEILVKTTITIVVNSANRCNKLNQELLVKYLLINSLKGICNFKQQFIIDDYFK